MLHLFEQKSKYIYLNIYFKT